MTLVPFVSTSLRSAAGLLARKLVGAMASSNSETTKRARSAVVGSIFASSTQRSSEPQSAAYACNSRRNTALSDQAASAKRRSSRNGAWDDRPATTRPHSAMNRAYCRESIRGSRAR